MHELTFGSLRPPAKEFYDFMKAETVTHLETPGRLNASPTMSSSPLDSSPVTPPWKHYFLADRSRTVRACVTVLIGLGAAWYLDAEGYGALQSALALGSILAVLTGLGLEPLIRERLRQSPEESTATLGTGMALRCSAGVIVYLAMVLLTSSHQATPRSIWLVAALLVITQTPLLLGLRLDEAAHQPRRRWAENIAFGLSAAMAATLVWRGADAVWFATAVVLEQPIASLLLLYGHEKIAPNEDAFTWEWSMAKDWLRRCWPPLATSLLPLALIPLAQLIVLWRNTPSQAGQFGVAALLFGFCLFCTSTLILGRQAAQPEDADDVASAGGEIDETFARAAKIGLFFAAGMIVLSVLLGLTLLRETYTNLPLAGSLLALGLIPATLTLVRGEYSRRLGGERATAKASLITAALNLAISFWLAQLWGANGMAGSVLVSLILGQLIFPFASAETRKLARAQWKGLMFWKRGSVAPASVPASASFTSLPPPDLADLHGNHHAAPAFDHASRLR